MIAMDPQLHCALCTVNYIVGFLKPRHNPYITLWCLTSSIPVTHCDAQNAKHQIKVLAFNDFDYTDLI
jgi:hypothetical protein